MLNIVRWYCDAYNMGLETGFLFGTIIVVQSLRPPLHGQDHISTIWQGCKILDQHSQYSHIVYHTTRKIDIQNSHEDLQILSWMEEHPNPFDTLYPVASLEGALIRANSQQLFRKYFMPVFIVKFQQNHWTSFIIIISKLWQLSVE